MTNKKQFEDACINFQKATYKVGFHMVCAILHFSLIDNQRITIENIMEMKPFDFIKYYERAAEYLGLKPIVSLNSGKGYFDYNRALRKLTIAYNIRRQF